MQLLFEALKGHSLEGDWLRNSLEAGFDGVEAGMLGRPVSPKPPETVLLRAALAISCLLFALRWDLAQRLGFGDAEALYVAYARFPQPAYLDHPGLVGSVARWLGGGSIPTAVTTHEFTAAASTLFPWFGVVAAMGAGAPRASALRVFFALALLPEFAIGLFALTPDLLLAYTWTAGLGLAVLAMRSEPKSTRAFWATLGAGAMVGFAALSKASGVLLGAALLAALMATIDGRARLKTAAPWCAIALAGLLVAPVVASEVREGFPMLRHRLIATQAEAGLSLRNLGALLGGQLLYVTPPLLYAGWRVGTWIHAHRREPVANVYWLAAVIPGALLALLCLWSRVAEPHWVAPAYLALCLAIALAPPLPRWLSRSCVATGLFVAVLSWAFVGTPLPMKLLGGSYEARYDLSNDLYAWSTGKELLTTAITSVRAQTGHMPVVVGPHYTICAQALVALEGHVSVGCRTPEGDDFDRWLPRTRWHAARTILFVTDNRFDVDPAAEFPDRSVMGVWRGSVLRGGVRVRAITVTRLDLKHAVASGRDPHA